MSEQTPLMSDKAVAIRLAEMLAAHRDNGYCEEIDGYGEQPCCWRCETLRAAIKALSHAEAAGASVPQEAAISRRVDRDVDLRMEMRAYLDTLVTTGESIGDIRRSLFVPWDSSWNGWVRDDTAARERSSLTGEASSAPRGQR